MRGRWAPALAILVFAVAPFSMLVALHMNRAGPPPAGSVVAAGCAWDGRRPDSRFCRPRLRG